ncbi:MAG: SMC-Scp complex subunit ScpB [Clostridiales bacterium]|nr:SMC-Scp complex subunit ScpB [Clostridiales bacterium]
MRKERENDLRIEEYEAAAEAILFAMGDAVELSKIAAALEISEKDAELVIQKLTDRYRSSGSGLQIIELDGAYQMCTKVSQYEYLIRVAKQPKKHVLTDVVLETLSIVAYKQPVTRAEIEKIRGVSCEHAINRLLEYDLIRELGRLDAPGRPILFGTTEEFLRCFGVQSVDDLPSPDPEQIEEMKQEAQEEVQLKLNL